MESHRNTFIFIKIKANNFLQFLSIKILSFLLCKMFYIPILLNLYQKMDFLCKIQKILKLEVLVLIYQIIVINSISNH